MLQYSPVNLFMLEPRKQDSRNATSGRANKCTRCFSQMPSEHMFCQQACSKTAYTCNLVRLSFMRIGLHSKPQFKVNVSPKRRKHSQRTNQLETIRLLSDVHIFAELLIEAMNLRLPWALCNDQLERFFLVFVSIRYDVCLCVFFFVCGGGGGQE